MLDVFISAAGETENDALICTKGRRENSQMRHSVGRFERGDNTLSPRQEAKSLKGFLIGHTDVLGAARIFEIAVFRTHAGIVQSRGHRMGAVYLSPHVLEQV